ncbi:hypothetical protein JRO89_XS15G0010800 [Xanthoceras sorbifolium]|uniref:RING-type domain-containing protein n=1 Tax=Xanthoceras sorbifolium TaxID=99658 RepID=A0ABQ8H0M9_9ROSI|nr:hypothetical protein JRO89_XS15G0010800 [Xanthoceras sorbifolium]
MATYQLEFWQNNGVLNRANHHWHSVSSGFQIELHLHRHNNGVLRATNRMFYLENRVFLFERQLQESLIRILLEEQIPLNSNGVQFIHHSPSGLPVPIPVYSLEHLVFFLLQTVRLVSNDPRNRFLTLLPIHLYIAIDESRRLQFLDDSVILDGEYLDGGLQQLDNSIILDGESFEEVGLSNTAVPILLKEEKVEVSIDCSICLESVGVGEVVARLLCSHLYHTTCITRWLHKKPSCPLCRALVV